MSLPDMTTVIGLWPTVMEQIDARSAGCTCVQVKNQTHLEPAEWEQDPYCVVHPDAAVMRATVLRLCGMLNDLRSAVMDEWGYGSQSLECRRVLGRETFDHLHAQAG